MNITEIRIRRVTGEGKLRAFASITIDDQLVIHDLKVIEGSKGLFVAMPSRRGKDGEFKDIAHPILTETRELIQKKVLQEYQNSDSLEPVDED